MPHPRLLPGFWELPGRWVMDETPSADVLGEVGTELQTLATLENITPEDQSQLFSRLLAQAQLGWSPIAAVGHSTLPSLPSTGRHPQSYRDEQNRLTNSRVNWRNAASSAIGSL